MKSIHKFLFEDIYDWAGQIRTVDIAYSILDARERFGLSAVG